ncbi:BadF/BadG/BcrA/BcrD ATPase family protein [Fluviispira sanaruensis]|uniref:N-acetylglucosamine kinase n=1 Tax=Fluviispira sanaruensis TaxID=2493639 RepID=A0A4P2VM67_FLUSA|nr:BadF/BadG/BcrA/BcrD ATPase family protein [Fluviispira sanaruensis]BBH52519.1 N-acetylglucosamine kinase [Fluviispira sanaruensis]
MMKKNYFIGVDGGGTKTQIRLESEDGKVLGEGLAGPANIRLSVDVAINSIVSAFEQALQIANLTEMRFSDEVQFHVGMGLAGYEVHSVREEFLAKQKGLGFAHCHIQSDAFVACLGAHSGNYGSIIICGTGVVGLKYAKKGKFQVGGWGFPHGDEGGAAWLGLEAIRKTLHLCDGRGIESPLLLHIKKKLGDKVESVTEWACYANATKYAELARDVFKFAEEKDSIALYLLNNAATHIEKIFFALDKVENETKIKLPCSLVGGVSQFILPLLKPNIKKRLVPARGDACDGALLMIREKYNQS